MRQDILDLVEKSGVRYALLHATVSQTGDTDIVAAPESMDALRRALSAQYRIVQIWQYEATGTALVVAARDGTDDRFEILDVTTDYRWNGRVLLRGSDLLDAAQRFGPRRVVAPEHELIYLLLKKVYDKGFVPPEQRRRLRELILEQPRAAEEATRRFFGDGWSRKISTWIESERWENLEAAVPGLRRAVRWQTFRRDPLNPLRYWTGETWRVWTRLRRPTGLTVSVLGPDGAGKSTLIAGIATRTAGAFRRHRIFHWRPTVLWGRVSGPVTAPHRDPPRDRWASALKLIAVVLDYWLGYLVVKECEVRSGLVLFDRYFYDLMVDSKRYRYGGGRWLPRLLSAVIPSPDLVFVLDAPARMMWERKPEVPLAEVERQREAYRRLAESRNWAVLDASRTPAEVAKEASRLIVEHLERRVVCREKLASRIQRAGGDVLSTRADQGALRTGNNRHNPSGRAGG